MSLYQKQSYTASTCSTVTPHSCKEEIVKIKLTRKKVVSWTKDTIDNSKMNKKCSKVCCIFPKDDEEEDKLISDKNKYERM